MYYQVERILAAKHVRAHNVWLLLSTWYFNNSSLLGDWYYNGMPDTCRDTNKELELLH